MEINYTDLIQDIKSELLISLKQSKTEIKEETKDSLSKLIQEGDRAAAEQNVLKSLKYHMMGARYSNIEDAHEHTFNWIFEDPSTSPFPQVKFLEWLQSHSGIYWVSGKAGSGKSTLMRYLCKDSRTFKALKMWAGSKKLVMANHFFWIGGNRMQKSQEGLLCSLLDGILTQCPALIPIVTYSRWKASLRHQRSNLYLWTRNELLQAFVELRGQEKIPVKFCFFVDGLDEYEGDHAEVVKVLKNITDSLDIKICLSSRPWNIFEYSLGKDHDRKLMLQDLTREDIRLYIRERLEEDARFVDLEDDDNESEPYTKNDLVSEIVNMAEGVFLWVHLVVNDLLEGATNADKPRTLRERLHTLPENLEEYFMAMLNRVHKVYHQQTAQILQMSLAAKEPLSLMTLSYLDENDPDYALKAKIKSLPDGDLEKICEDTRKRVKARCADLMDIVDSRKSDVVLRYQVHFLHRTVRDFLLTKEIQDVLAARLRAPFDTNVYLCRSLLAQMKVIPRSRNNMTEEGTLKTLLMEFLYYALEWEASGAPLQVQLLDEVDRVLASHWSFTSEETVVSPPMGTSEFQENYQEGILLVLALQWGLCTYVKHKLDEDPNLVRGLLRQPMLHIALMGLRKTDYWYHLGQDTKMVRLLLDRGGDANQTHNETSVWGHFLKLIHKTISFHKEQLPSSIKMHWTEIIEILLCAGANPDVQVQTSMTSPQGGIGGRVKYAVYTSAFDIIQTICSPQDCVRLRRIADERRQSGWRSWLPWNPWGSNIAPT